MKRLLMLTLLAVMLANSTGCCVLDRLFCCRRGGCCDPCGGGCGPVGGGCGPCGGGCYDSGPLCPSCGPGGGNGGNGGMYGGGGPQSAQVAYPYYTTRGPRDFYANNPGYPRN